MPSYVYSTLSLEGNKDDIKRFREKFEEDGELKATNVIPYPRDLGLLDKNYNKKNEIKDEDNLTDEDERELTLIGLEGKYDMSRDGYNQGGYNWCIKNWGTKWGFCECYVEQKSDYSLLYNFSTAWSSIEIVIIEMSKQFPKIEFNYHCDEESGEFRYEETYLNGIRTYFNDLSYEIEAERRQEEEDNKLEQERDKQIEDKLEESKNG